MEDLRIFNLRNAGREAIQEYLKQRCVSSGFDEINKVLEGGLEAGNYYLWLGSAKSGKSTTLRALGMKLAENFPVLYLNFEQPGKNIFAKFYQLRYGISLREEVHEDLKTSFENVSKFPDIPFYMAFWPDNLEEKAFNTTIKPLLEQSVEFIRKEDKEDRIPVIIMENLSDIYNERTLGSDSLTNIVTQTAQDIRNFNIKNNTAMFLAQHSAKLKKGQKFPKRDDVRDSKRVVDLAHSIFVCFTRGGVENDKPDDPTEYYLAYLAGRGQSEYKEWKVVMNGLDMNLLTKNDDQSYVLPTNA